MTRQTLETQVLTSLSRSRRLSKCYSERSKILLSHESLRSKRGTSRQLRLDIQKVRRWVNRWEASDLIREDLYLGYQSGLLSWRGYVAEVQDLLSDLPRSGCPATFRPSEVEQIIALGSSSPEELGLPFTHWSNELLKQEAVSRGIVVDISARQVGRFLKYAPPTASSECLLGVSQHLRLG